MASRYTDNVKDDAYYAKRILKSIEMLTRYLAGKLQDDRNCIRTASTMLVQMGSVFFLFPHFCRPL